MTHDISDNLPTEAPWPDAAPVLTEKDPVLAELIARGGGAPARIQPVANAWEALARAIMHRGWSARAASKAIRILLRLRPQFESRFPTAAEVFELSLEELRETGLGERQAQALWNAARRVAEGEVDLARIDTLPDAEVISRLSVLYGVKEWTAKMYLVFHLKRPDVLITGDKGLYRAAARFYPDELPEDPPDWAAFERLAERWRPYRSAATWYLWHYGAGFKPGLYEQPDTLD